MQVIISFANSDSFVFSFLILLYLISYFNVLTGMFSTVLNRSINTGHASLPNFKGSASHISPLTIIFAMYLFGKKFFFSFLKFPSVPVLVILIQVLSLLMFFFVY